MPDRLTSQTDKVLEETLFPKDASSNTTDRPMPDFAYIRKELLRNGVTKKLLWSEDVDVPLMHEKRTGHVSLMTKEDWMGNKKL